LALPSRAFDIPPGMFCISETEAATIRTAYEQDGELSAAIELRRLSPGITDNAKARECVRSIAGWTPLPAPVPKVPLRPASAAATALCALAVSIPTKTSLPFF
jgi:hypothetical protein